MTQALVTFTDTWHSTSYGALNPSRREQLAKDKLVVIAEGGDWAGKAIGNSFACANAEAIILLGRTKTTLKATATSIRARVKGVIVQYLDIDETDQDSVNRTMKAIHETYGPIDVPVSKLGFFGDDLPYTSAEIHGWGQILENNICGNLNLVRAFIAHAADEAVLVNVTAGRGHMAASTGNSLFAWAKSPTSRLLDIVNSEVEKLFVFNVHPGVPECDVSRMMDLPAQIVDGAQLTGDFVVMGEQQ